MKNFIFKSSEKDLLKIYDLVKILANEQRHQRVDLGTALRRLNLLLKYVSPQETLDTREQPDEELEAQNGDSVRTD